MKTLLFANADEALSSIYCRFFTAQGYRTESSTNGLDCLARLRRWAPDILVLERELPWGGGDGLVSMMRHDITLPMVPVILVTGASAVAEIPGLIVAPVVACLTKPFRLRTLVKMICHTESLLVDDFTSPRPPEDGSPAAPDFLFSQREPWKSVFG